VRTKRDDSCSEVLLAQSMSCEQPARISIYQQSFLLFLRGRHRDSETGKNDAGGMLRAASSDDDEEVTAAAADRGAAAGVPERESGPDSLLYEVKLPTVVAAPSSNDIRRNHHHAQQARGQPLHFTGGAQGVADLLVCAACKHWLQWTLCMT
jgi:hypothetical protein